MAWILQKGFPFCPNRPCSLEKGKVSIPSLSYVHIFVPADLQSAGAEYGDLQSP